MLTPMQVQYVVGLCCLRRNPDAVDVTLGKLVPDVAAEKGRDIDITVTVEEAPGVIRAFKGFEVKRESHPLDVASVEQLCAKFNDMPSITHRAIVSASGYTAPAVKKAEAHKVELYEIKQWDQPIGEQFPAFPGLGKPEDVLLFGRSLLIWLLPRTRFHLTVQSGPASFSVEDSSPILSSDGSTHPTFQTLGQYKDALMLRSTQFLYSQEPATTILTTIPPTVELLPVPRSFSPPWPHTHTLDVAKDAAFLKVNEQVVSLEQVTINGFLRWDRETLRPDYQVLVRVPGKEVFAGAAIAPGIDDDELVGFVLSPTTRETGVHRFRLTERQKNIIRELKLQQRS